MPDVVILGAGAMGSATAWWLARRGREVVLLEQFEQGHAKGSSHGSSRIFRLAYYDPAYVRMAQEALPLWRELEADTGKSLLDTTGAVDHGDPRLVDAVAAALRTCGAAHEVIHASERESGGPACGSRATSCSIRTVGVVAPTTRSARCRTAPRLSAPTSASVPDGLRCARHRAASKSTSPARRSLRPSRS